MFEVGRNLGQRDQHKGSLVHSWVGNGKTFLGDDFLAVEKQVKVECSCFRLLRPRSSALRLDLEHEVQQGVGSKGCFHQDDGVEELPSWARHRLRFVEGRDLLHTALLLLQAIQRVA